MLNIELLNSLKLKILLALNIYFLLVIIINTIFIIYFK